MAELASGAYALLLRWPCWSYAALNSSLMCEEVWGPTAYASRGKKNAPLPQWESTDLYSSSHPRGIRMRGPQQATRTKDLMNTILAFCRKASRNS